jgi:hypothetical protein
MGLSSDGSTVFDAGAMAAGFGGALVFIKKLTASNSATLSFVNGASSVVLDTTYKEYLFTLKNIHAGTDDTGLTFNVSIDGGTNYNVAKTTTFFRESPGWHTGQVVMPIISHKSNTKTSKQVSGRKVDHQETKATEKLNRSPEGIDL